MSARVRKSKVYVDASVCVEIDEVIGQIDTDVLIEELRTRGIEEPLSAVRVSDLCDAVHLKTTDDVIALLRQYLQDLTGRVL